MKKRLGISLYPDLASKEANIKYLEMARFYGFDILFIAFLDAKGTREEIIENYLPYTSKAKELGFEIIADVNPQVFDKIGVNASLFKGPLDLSFFEILHVDVMRLDYGMSSLEEAFLTKNKYGIKVCMNAGGTADHVATVLAAGGEKDMIMGCHNYYPHRFTGIALERFIESTHIWNRHNIRCSVFISSQQEDAFGPWPVTEGLPTIEMHRNLPLDIQFKHLMMMNIVDDIIIGNCFASQEELKAIAKSNTEHIEFHVDLAEGVPQFMVERLHMQLSCRNDVNEYLIRSLESRLIKGEIPPFNTVDIHKGDILIDNDLYGQYAGEVQIALQDMPNYGKTNVVGHIKEEEIILIDYLAGGQQFVLKDK